MKPRAHLERRAVQERWGKEDFQKELERAFWNHPIVVQHLNRLSTGSPDCDWLTLFTHRCLPRDRPRRVLVLGCGEGWLERSIAPLDWVERIDAFDVASGAVDRARERAAAEGLDNIRYGVKDLNTDTLETNAYDVVIAHSVLHHIEGLEHAFGTIRESLRSGAWIAINEYVGPPHLQYREEAMQVMNRVMVALEPRLRRAALSGGTMERKERPALDYILEVDPSEGVRADELEAFIQRNFQVVYQRGMGGTVLQHLLYELVANFDPEDDVDNCLLKWICLLEESVIESGGMPADYQFFVCRPLEEGAAALSISRTMATVHQRLPRGDDPAWRSTPAALAHFHGLGTGNEECDWLTRILAELEAIGVGHSARILWVGGEAWMLRVLAQNFDRVEHLSSGALLNPRARFDAAFGCATTLLDRSSRRRLARIGLTLKKTGAMVLIEEDGPDATRSEWVDRFATPLARLAEMKGLPEPDVAADEPLRLPELFQIERASALGEDLLEPILDTYGERVPADRLNEIVRLLAVIEREALSTGVFESKKQGVLLVGPRTKPLVASLVRG